MKHQSTSALQRAAKTWFAEPKLPTEDDLRQQIRDRLASTDDKHALARQLKVTPFQLTGILRGRWPISDQVAEALGYRRVTRFEPIDG